MLYNIVQGDPLIRQREVSRPRGTIPERKDVQAVVQRDNEDRLLPLSGRGNQSRGIYTQCQKKQPLTA